MVITQGRSKKKISGSKKIPYRKKRLSETGSRPTLTMFGERQVRITRMKGGKSKTRLQSIAIANILDKKTKRFTKAKILNVVENPANRHYVRRGIITKGTIIETDKGKAKVTSRPGQSSSVNAVLV